MTVSEKDFLNLHPGLDKTGDFYEMRQKTIHVLFAAALVLPLTSCNKGGEQDWSGMEYFTFKITGKVTDPSGSPINGISVTALGAQTLTSPDGTYTLNGTGGTETSTFVNFTDIDGLENGGRYIGNSVPADLEYIKGKHGPYLGLFGKSDVNVTMTAGPVNPGSGTPL